MEEYDLCPVCGKQWLETTWSQDTDEQGFPANAYEECKWCGWEAEWDGYTGEYAHYHYPAGRG